MTISISTRCRASSPAVIQDADNGDVLMLGFMNAESLQLTFSTGFVTFYSPHPPQALDEGRDQRQSPARRLAPPPIAIRTRSSSACALQGDGLVCHEGTRSCFTRR